MQDEFTASAIFPRPIATLPFRRIERLCRGDPPLSHTTDVLLFRGHPRPLPAWDRTRTPKENSTQYGNSTCNNKRTLIVSKQKPSTLPAHALKASIDAPFMCGASLVRLLLVCLAVCLRLVCHVYILQSCSLAVSFLFAGELITDFITYLSGHP